MPPRDATRRIECCNGTYRYMNPQSCHNNLPPSSHLREAAVVILNACTYSTHGDDRENGSIHTISSLPNPPNKRIVHSMAPANLQSSRTRDSKISIMARFGLLTAVTIVFSFVIALFVLPPILAWKHGRLIKA